MSDLQFDPFGEPVAISAGHGPKSGRGPKGGSRAVLRVGIGIFWTLVIAIVAARVAYFDPDFAKNFVNVAALSNFFHAVIGA